MMPEELSELGVARHEAGHFGVGIFHGFDMGAVLLWVGGGPEGLAANELTPGDLDGDDARRRWIRVCLAGEVARIGATSLDDFHEAASGDVERARGHAELLPGDPDNSLKELLAETVEDVEAVEKGIGALAERLVNTTSHDGRWKSRGAGDAARCFGYHRCADGSGFEPGG